MAKYVEPCSYHGDGWKEDENGDKIPIKICGYPCSPYYSKECTHF